MAIQIDSNAKTHFEWSHVGGSVCVCVCVEVPNSHDIMQQLRTNSFKYFCHDAIAKYKWKHMLDLRSLFVAPYHYLLLKQWTDLIWF